MITLKKGDPCYIDTEFSGLIPGRVVRIEQTDEGKKVVAKVTTTSRAYKQGELITSDGARRVVPRSAVRKSRTRLGAYYIVDFVIGDAEA